jgi:hypothetical protein
MAKKYHLIYLDYIRKDLSGLVRIDKASVGTKEQRSDNRYEC